MNDANLTDSALLRSWVAGDPNAGNALLARHFAVVHRFFRNKVGADLEDLCQQTFLGCVEAHTRYQERASFVTFLLSIARNKLYNHYRSRRRETTDFSVLSVIELGTSPSGTAAKHEEAALVARALQAIPVAAQLILELAYWEGLDAKDIGDVLEVPVGVVYTRLHRARAQLRAKLTELAPHRQTNNLISWPVDT